MTNYNTKLFLNLQNQTVAADTFYLVSTKYFHVSFINSLKASAAIQLSRRVEVGENRFSIIHQYFILYVKHMLLSQKKWYCTNCFQVFIYFLAFYYKQPQRLNMSFSLAYVYFKICMRIFLLVDQPKCSKTLYPPMLRPSFTSNRFAVTYFFQSTIDYSIV